MSQEIDYPTSLKQFLWKRLKRKNEPFDKFEKRIEGRYFSDEVLDYPLLLQIINDPRNPYIYDTDTIFTDTLYNANILFLKVFESNAKSRLNKIMSKVNDIIKTHAESHYLRNAIILILLSIFYEEKSLKQRAAWDHFKVRPEIQKAIEKDLGSFLRSLNDLGKIFRNDEISYELPYSDQYYRERIIEPIQKKAIDIEFSNEMLLEFAKFIEYHKHSEIAELKAIKLEYAAAKREQDYSELSRINLRILFNFLKDEIGIQAEQAKRDIAEFFDLFEIRPIKAIIQEFAEDEVLNYQDALKTSAKRIGDIIRKTKLNSPDAKEK